MPPLRKQLSRWAAFAALVSHAGGAAVLPDDRADLFYSSYQGGGMDITGESVLVRKKFSENFAVEGNYFIDKVSGASVDVLSNASVIKDERKQKTISVEYIHDKTMYTASYSNSTENDYRSNTTHFSLSQDMFGDLTTVTLGFTRSRDGVGEHDGNNPATGAIIVDWLGHAESRSYEAGISQVITKNLIGGVTLEVITDDGYLANPYRFIVVPDPSTGRGFDTFAQVYPETRTSTAVETRAKYYLPYRAAASASYRYFRDTWGVRANTYEVDYTQPWSNIWIFEGRVRYYKQGHATFYSDYFAYPGEQNFEARDKDLAGSQNTTVGGKVTYAFLPTGWSVFKRGTVTADVSRVQFKYDDFSDLKGFTLADAPLYSFTAKIYQVYLSVFF